MQVEQTNTMFRAFVVKYLWPFELGTGSVCPQFAQLTCFDATADPSAFRRSSQRSASHAIDEARASSAPSVAPKLGSDTVTGLLENITVPSTLTLSRLNGLDSRNCRRNPSSHLINGVHPSLLYSP
jgi:hypothetical protein